MEKRNGAYSYQRSYLCGHMSACSSIWAEILASGSAHLNIQLRGLPDQAAQLAFLSDLSLQQMGYISCGDHYVASPLQGGKLQPHPTAEHSLLSYLTRSMAREPEQL